MCNLQCIPTPLLFCTPGPVAPVLAVTRSGGQDSLTWTWGGAPGTFFKIQRFLSGSFYPAVEGAGVVATTAANATSYTLSDTPEACTYTLLPYFMGVQGRGSNSVALTYGTPLAPIFYSVSEVYTYQFNADFTAGTRDEIIFESRNQTLAGSFATIGNGLPGTSPLTGNPTTLTPAPRDADNMECRLRVRRGTLYSPYSSVLSLTYFV